MCIISISAYYPVSSVWHVPTMNKSTSEENNGHIFPCSTQRLNPFPLWSIGKTILGGNESYDIPNRCDHLIVNHSALAIQSQESENWQSEQGHDQKVDYMLYRWASHQIHVYTGHQCMSVFATILWIARYSKFMQLCLVKKKKKKLYNLSMQLPLSPSRKTWQPWYKDHNIQCMWWSSISHSLCISEQDTLEILLLHPSWAAQQLLVSLPDSPMARSTLSSGFHVHTVVQVRRAFDLGSSFVFPLWVAVSLGRGGSPVAVLALCSLMKLWGGDTQNYACKSS